MRIVFSANDYGLRFSRLEKMRDIGEERCITAVVLDDVLIVHPDAGIPVDRTKVHDKPLSRRHLGNFESALIPHGFVKACVGDVAGGSFRGEGNSDLLGEIDLPGMNVRALWVDDKVPGAVQALPVGTFQLGSRIAVPKTVEIERLCVHGKCSWLA